MEDANPAKFAIVPLLTANIVSADRRNLHFAKPLHQLFAILEAGFIELTIRKERLLAFLIEPSKPTGVQNEDIVLLDHDALLLRCPEQVIDRDTLATVEVFLALVPGSVNEDAAADHAMVRDGFDRALLQAAYRGL